MKKTKIVRNTKVKKVVTNGSCCSNCIWSWAIYVYWFIILFFIAATFYIIGRGHEFLHPSRDIVITEEALMRPQDYVDSAKQKIIAGDMEAALNELNVAIDANASSDVYALRGEIYMQMGEYQDALADFDAAIEVDGMNAIAFYDRYLLNSRLENYDMAMTDINNALAAQSMKPADVLTMRDLYAKRGQLNLWMKNWQGAVADYTNSLARSEGSVSANVYAERAEAYTAIGEYEAAINDYAAAMRVVSEQILAATTQEMREEQSSNVMSYFEKSAALKLKLGRDDMARSDLESAFAIAVALNDTESADRIQNLINGIY